MNKKIIDFTSKHLFLSFLIFTMIILFIIVAINFPTTVIFILLIILGTSDGIIALFSAIYRTYYK